MIRTANQIRAGIAATSRIAGTAEITDDGLPRIVDIDLGAGRLVVGYTDIRRRYGHAVRHHYAEETR